MKRRRKDSAKLKKRLWIVNIVLFVCLIVSVCALTIILGNYAKNRRGYEQASELAVTTPELASTTDAPADEVSLQQTPAPPRETPPVQVDFDLVKEQGRRVAAWLYCADTVLDYPVVVYTDNEFFLTHDYTGARSSAGALFFDSRNTAELTGDQLIIYGHHMKDRSMFGNLPEYHKQAYYDLHPALYLLTPEKQYRVELFAGRYVDSEVGNFPVWFTSKQARQQYIETAIANSDFVPASTVYHEDGRVLCLVTCAYSNYIDEAKYQLLGWLVELN